jgi:hypothetical protein
MSCRQLNERCGTSKENRKPFFSAFLEAGAPRAELEPNRTSSFACPNPEHRSSRLLLPQLLPKLAEMPANADRSSFAR